MTKREVLLKLTAIVSIINAAVVLEPIALNLILQLAQKLSGKSTEEVLAMNEAIFNKIIADADAELAKLPPST